MNLSIVYSHVSQTQRRINQKAQRQLVRRSSRRDLVWRKKLEICRRIGDDVALGARHLLLAGGRVAEPIQTDRQDAERPEQLREEVAVVHVILQTHSAAVGYSQLHWRQ